MTTLRLKLQIILTTFLISSNLTKSVPVPLLKNLSQSDSGLGWRGIFSKADTMFNGLNSSFYAMQSGINGMNTFKRMLHDYMNGKKFTNTQAQKSKELKLVSGKKKTDLESKFTNLLVKKVAKHIEHTKGTVHKLIHTLSKTKLKKKLPQIKNLATHKGPKQIVIAKKSGSGVTKGLSKPISTKKKSLVTQKPVKGKSDKKTKGEADLANMLSGFANGVFGGMGSKKPKVKKGKFPTLANALQKKTFKSLGIPHKKKKKDNALEVAKDSLETMHILNQKKGSKSIPTGEEAVQQTIKDKINDMDKNFEKKNVQKPKKNNTDKNLISF